MNDRMNDDIAAAIKQLAEKSTEEATKSHEALQWTQAALNLAHTAQVMNQVNAK